METFSCTAVLLSRGISRHVWKHSFLQLSYCHQVLVVVCGNIQFYSCLTVTRYWSSCVETFSSTAVLLSRGIGRHVWKHSVVQLSYCHEVLVVVCGNIQLYSCLTVTRYWSSCVETFSCTAVLLSPGIGRHVWKHLVLQLSYCHEVL